MVVLKFASRAVLTLLSLNATLGVCNPLRVEGYRTPGRRAPDSQVIPAQNGWVQSASQPAATEYPTVVAGRSEVCQPSKTRTC
jgi:hypothetical protein